MNSLYHLKGFFILWQTKLRVSKHAISKYNQFSNDKIVGHNTDINGFEQVNDTNTVRGKILILVLEEVPSIFALNKMGFKITVLIEPKLSI